MFIEERGAGINCNYGLCEEGRCSCQTGYVGFYCDTPSMFSYEQIFI